MAAQKHDPASQDAPGQMSDGGIPDGAVERIRELEAENAQLRAAVETLRAAGPADVKTFDRQPRRPSFGLSAGEASDLQLHGVTSSPFTGETLTASGEGVEPANDEARAADRRAAARAGK